MTHRILAIGLAAAVGATVAGQQVARGQAADRPEGPVVPVYHEPHHRQVFQYGPTRILDLQMPPGDISWFHSHDAPILYIPILTAQIRTQVQGEDWSGGGGGGRGAAGRGGAGRGRVSSTTRYAEAPLTHRLENIGDGLLRAIVVVNETPGDPADAVPGTSLGEEAELVNPWFRAYRHVVQPRQSLVSHTHRVPVAVVQTSEGRGQAVGPMPFELNEPGQWAFFDAGAAHVVRNVGETVLELVEVEVRRPADGP